MPTNSTGSCSICGAGLGNGTLTGAASPAAARSRASLDGQPGAAVPTFSFQGESMLVVMKAQASEEQVRAVCEKIEKLGYRAHPMPGATRTAIGITGNQGEVEQGTLEEMPGVQEVIQVSKPYKLVSRDVKEENTIIRFPDTTATLGGTGLAIVAGPCAIESREQAFAVAERVHRSGAQFFRGGAYKPRTSPYSFQGLEEEALRIDRKSTRLNSSHPSISYAVFCLK